MSRVFFASELEGVGDLLAHSSPGRGDAGLHQSRSRPAFQRRAPSRRARACCQAPMRRTAALDGDSAEMQGALAHDSIRCRRSRRMAASTGRGWRSARSTGKPPRTRCSTTVRSAQVAQEGAGFTAELRSAKAALEADPGAAHQPDLPCGILRAAAAGFRQRASRQRGVMVSGDPDDSASRSTTPTPVRCSTAPCAGSTDRTSGLAMEVAAVDGANLVLDAAIDPALAAGTRAILREGCDHTIAACSGRFGNAVNFRGEPFLPGNDLLARYPSPGVSGAELARGCRNPRRRAFSAARARSGKRARLRRSPCGGIRPLRAHTDDPARLRPAQPLGHIAGSNSPRTPDWPRSRGPRVRAT